MINLNAVATHISQPVGVETPVQDLRVRGGLPSDAWQAQEKRVVDAVNHVFAHPAVKCILGASEPLDKASLQAVVNGALQSYSRSAGVLSLVNALREKIGDARASHFKLDGTPLAIVRSRVHESLMPNDEAAELSGTSKIKSYELGRVVLARGVNGSRDALNRKTHVLNIHCELAPNLYESPISALMVGIAQEVFLYPKVAEVLHQKTTRSREERFMSQVLTSLGIPVPGDAVSLALHKVEMRVFEHVLHAAYLASSELDATERCLSSPVAELMFFKQKRLRYDTPLGNALKIHLQRQFAGSAKAMELAELLDLFQARIRDCRAVSAPPAAIGRAYFNTQFRNLLCEAEGIATSQERAAFELRVRAYRDAPTNSALLNHVRTFAPANAKKDADKIIKRHCSDEAMVFELELD